MRRILVALVALLLLLAAGWMAATWAVAAGSRAWFEEGLRRTEALLQRFAGGEKVRARLESFEEGTLSGRARTSWTIGEAPGDTPLPLVHEISHGPDWSPAGGFRMWRVETRIDRERLPPADREEIARAFGDAEPLLFELATADGRSFTGRFVLARGELDADGAPLRLGGAELDFRLTAEADGGLSGDLQGKVGGLAFARAGKGEEVRLAPFDFATRFDLAEPCPGGWLSGETTTSLRGVRLEGENDRGAFTLQLRELGFENSLGVPPDRPGGSRWWLRADLGRLEAGGTTLADLVLSAELRFEPLARATAVAVCEVAELAGRVDPPERELEARLLAILEDLLTGPAGVRLTLGLAEKDRPPHRLEGELGWPRGPRPGTLGELADRARGRLELDVGLEAARSPELQRLLVMPVALGIARIEDGRVRADVRLADGMLHLPAGPRTVGELLGPLANAPLLPPR